MTASLSLIISVLPAVSILDFILSRVIYSALEEPNVNLEHAHELARHHLHIIFKLPDFILLLE